MSTRSEGLHHYAYIKHTNPKLAYKHEKTISITIAYTYAHGQNQPNKRAQKDINIYIF